MPTKSASSGARRADVTGFDVPEHHGDGFGVASARPKRRSHDRRLMLLEESVVTSDAGLLAYRELDAALGMPDTRM